MSGVVVLEYQGAPVAFDATGWFNATHPAKRYGKEPNDWLRQRETVEYIAILAAGDGNSGFVPELNEIKDLASRSGNSRRRLLELVKRMGYVRTKAGAGGGTWMHPRLAVPFARWLDARFAVWCDEQIIKIQHGAVQAKVTNLYNARLAFDREFAVRKDEGSRGGRMLSSWKKVKRPLEAMEKEWQTRMEPGLFGDIVAMVGA